MDEVKILERKDESKPCFLRSISAQELIDISPESYLIDDFIPSGSRVCVLAGDGSVGKTFLCLHTELSICMNQQTWFGRAIHENGPVLYLAAEGESSLPVRIRAWLQDKDISFTEIENRFHVLDSKAIFEDGGSLVFSPDNKTFQEFLKSIEDSGINYAMAAIDTLNLFAKGEENNAADMGNFMKALKKLASVINHPVIVLHHTAKYDDETYRGSTAIRDNADNLFKLTKVEGSADTIRLIVDKARDGETGENTAMYLRKRKIFIDNLYSESGKQVSSLTLELVENAPTPPRSKKAVEDFNLMDNLLCKELEPKSIGEKYGFTRDNLTDALKKHYETEGNTPGEARKKANRNSNPSGDSLASRCIREGFIEWNPTINMFEICRHIDGLVWGWFLIRNHENREEQESPCSLFHEE